MAAGAGDERDVEALGPAHDGLDVGGAARLHDRGRPDAGVAQVEDLAGGVVAAVALRQDRPAHGRAQRPQLRPREGVGARDLRETGQRQRAGRGALQQLAT